MPRSVARLSTHDERDEDAEDHQSLLFMPPTPLEDPSAASSTYWSSSNSSASSSSSSTGDNASPRSPTFEDDNNSHARKQQKRTHWTPIILIQLMIFLTAMGVVISFAPRTRLFEDIICRKYYAIHNGTTETTTITSTSLLSATTTNLFAAEAPSESQCKIPPVQDVLAELLGWQIFFDGIPGLLLAMYYGVLADKKGRSAVLFRSLLGQVLAAGWVLYVAWRCYSASTSVMSDDEGIIGGWAPTHLLSLKATWLSSYFLIIGGGSTVTSAVGMMIVTDATTEENRSRVFFAALSTLITAELLGPAASTLMMRKWGLWVPLGIGFGCLVMSAILTANMPETMHLKRAVPQVDADPEALIPEQEEYDQDTDQSVVSGVNTKKEDVNKSAIQVYRHAAHTLGYIFHHPSILFVVLAFLVADYSRESLVMLMQFVSTRYQIPIAQANLLNSYRALTQLFTVTLLLPLLDLLLTSHFRIPALYKDLLLSRISFIFVTLCFAVLVWAPSLFYVFVSLTLYTLGSGFYPFARSLLASLVEPDMIGILFTTLAMMDTAGSLLAGPIVARSFGWSLGLEGVWRGLPYMVSCVLCAAATVALVVGVRAERPGSVEETMAVEGRKGSKKGKGKAKGRGKGKGAASVNVRALRDVEEGEEDDQEEGETRPLLAGR